MIEWDHSQRKKLVIYSGKKQSTSMIKSETKEKEIKKTKEKKIENNG